MRVLFGVLSVALLCACATSTGVGGTSGTDQVAAATAAWRTAYDSHDPARITAMYDSDAVLWGTTAKTVAANPAAIAEYFQDAGKRPNARVVFGEQNIRVYGDVGVTQVTTRSPMSEMANGYRVRRALPWCSEIETDCGASLVIIHPKDRSSPLFNPTTSRSSTTALIGGR